MATNEILRFAETDTGTNLLTQAEYLADAQRPIGNQPGVARSKLVNKALRQASLIAAGLAEYIADNQANNITDALTPQNIADYLQAAITGALGVTPPQFDNDTSLATTGFVQQAVGNLAGASYYTGVAALTASQAGRAIVCSGTFNLTLPEANTVPTGKGFYILSQAGYISVLRNGTDTINYGTVSGATSTTLGSGDWMYLYSTGTNQWVVLAGTPLLTVGQTSGVFGGNATANGWQRLPSGIIIQWMQFAKTTTASPISNSWPIAFPNALWNISGTIGGAANPNGGAISASGNTTQVTIYTTSGQPGGTIMVIGIGN